MNKDRMFVDYCNFEFTDTNLEAKKMSRHVPLHHTHGLYRDRNQDARLANMMCQGAQDYTRFFETEKRWVDNEIYYDKLQGIFRL